ERVIASGEVMHSDRIGTVGHVSERSRALEKLDVRDAAIGVGSRCREGERGGCGEDGTVCRVGDHDSWRHVGRLDSDCAGHKWMDRTMKRKTARGSKRVGKNSAGSPNTRLP